MFFTWTLVFSKTILVSGEKRFEPFFKNLEKTQNHVKISFIKKKNSLDALKDIEKNKALFAIVRGDILVDNMLQKNFFTQKSFQDFKVITKLDKNFATFLYLISKNGINDAYRLLNPDSSNKEMKKISIGQLKDLSNIYLADIAKSVNSAYRFKYKSYSGKESLTKINDKSIDAAYLFVSPEFVKYAKKEKFFVQNILKPSSVKSEKFAKKIREQKAFHFMPNGIRVDNYLIASSSVSDIDLSALVYVLKGGNSLITNIKGEYGEVDKRVASMSVKIDLQQAEAKAEAKAKEEECLEAKKRGSELSESKASLIVYTKNAKKKIRKVLSFVNQSNELSYFTPQLEHLLVSLNETNQESRKLINKTLKQISECSVDKIGMTLILLNAKVDEVQSSRKELALIESEIGRKKQFDIKSKEQEETMMLAELAKEERLLAQELVREQRNLEQKLVEKWEEQKAEVAKEEGGFFSILRGLIQ